MPENGTSLLSTFTENTDVLFLLSVVAPLIICCFAIFLCAVGSICKTRRKLDLLETKYPFTSVQDTNEFTVDLTTKMDSCVELTSTPPDSVLL
ncbi:unnamed protein product, partial [Mesorhabditis belari]|uniref:Uncharacterized protein n=1 Tax=Mesorhabditis belari TaxID=2138241 RepID=A0AAF3J6M7_9BILA